MNKPITRREFIRWMAYAAAASLAACKGTVRPTPTTQPTAGSTPAQPSAQASESATAAVTTPPTPEPTAEQAYLAAARGEDPAAITETALRALGGIERFVKSGYDVIIKPNICTDFYPYEYGATTNPIVVATLVRLALGAGARRVRVMDSPFGGSAESAYARSGIGDAVRQAGGEMEIMNPNKFRSTAIPEGRSLTECEIFQDVLNCDLLIDVPTAKHHNMAIITAGCKNLMGVIRNRGTIHADMRQRIPDLVSVIRPGLTVVDAVRTLMANGPTGGNLNDVRINNTVIASHDVVAADSYATRLFNMSGTDLPYLVNAAERALGSMDLNGLKIAEVSL